MPPYLPKSSKPVAIIINHTTLDHTRARMNEWEGERLDLIKISRLDMGAYLCIASNGVPPTVSKRIKVVDAHLLLLCCVCRKTFYHACVNLTSSETRLINSKKSVSWTCGKCDQMGGDINALKAAIVSLQNEIKTLSTKNNKADLSNTQFEDIVQEVLERQNRRCNVIIFGLKEQSITSKDERLALEKSEVVKVLTHVTESVTVTNIRRLGKYDRNRTSARPVKVSLANAEQVSELIRKSQTLKNSEAFKHVSISTDKTPRQMDLYKAVKSELEERKKKGETNIKIKHVNVVFAGDFNIPLYGSDENDSKHRLINNFAELFELRQYNSIPNHNNRYLDLVFTNTTCQMDRSDIPLVNEDRHHPALQFMIDIKTPKLKKFTPKHQDFVYNFRKANYARMYEIISTVDWNDVLQCADPNSATETLQQILFNIFGQTVPLKIISTRRFPPWYSIDTIKKIKEKEGAHKNYKKFGQEFYHKKFVSLRKTIKTQIDNDSSDAMDSSPAGWSSFGLLGDFGMFH
nr:unnamed protein product [Callosobruchus chinensis]